MMMKLLYDDVITVNIFEQIIVSEGILDESHVITSSYNHFIIMRTHRWPYGPCLALVLEFSFFLGQTTNASISNCFTKDSKPVPRFFQIFGKNFCKMRLNAKKICQFVEKILVDPVIQFLRQARGQ